MDTRNLVRHANQILSHFFVIFWIKIPFGIYEDLDMCVCVKSKEPTDGPLACKELTAASVISVY